MSTFRIGDKVNVIAFGEVVEGGEVDNLRNALSPVHVVFDDGSSGWYDIENLRLVEDLFGPVPSITSIDEGALETGIISRGFKIGDMVAFNDAPDIVLGHVIQTCLWTKEVRVLNSHGNSWYHMNDIQPYQPTKDNVGSMFENLGRAYTARLDEATVRAAASDTESVAREGYTFHFLNTKPIVIEGKFDSVDFVQLQEMFMPSTEEPPAEKPERVRMVGSGNGGSIIARHGSKAWILVDGMTDPLTYDAFQFEVVPDFSDREIPADVQMYDPGTQYRYTLTFKEWLS